MQIQLPEQVNFIISQLEAAGYEAYAVGGCVRDSILGRTPDDWDVTTSARPQQVKELFRHTIDTGIRHGTVTVMLCHEGYEVTTYRIDGTYEDGRHPKEVLFTSRLAEDLRRRDFTINAMAYNAREGIVDMFGGMEDLRLGIIRCVGTATERFLEDALRILRAVRFSAQLGFEIAPDTRAAITELAPNLKKISAERIQAELVKLLLSGHPDTLREAYLLGITWQILPELDKAFATLQNNPHHLYDVGEHTIQCLTHTRADRTLRLAALFHDLGKPSTKTTDETGTDHFYGHAQESEQLAELVLRRLKFDNDTITNVKKLVKYHDDTVEARARSVRRALCRMGEDTFAQVLELKQADILAQSMYQRREKLAHLECLWEKYRQILEQHQCISLKTLRITGTDLIALGAPKGKAIGRMLNALLEDVLCEPENNTRQYLLDKAKILLDSGEFMA